MTDTLIKVLELPIAFFADVFHTPFLKGSGIESLIQEEFSNFSIFLHMTNSIHGK
jgi:hypothetical protein